MYSLPISQRIFHHGIEFTTVYMYIHTVYWLIVSPCIPIVSPCFPLFIIHYNPILSPLHHHGYPLIYVFSPNFTTIFSPWHWVYYRIYIYIHIIYTVYWLIVSPCIPIVSPCFPLYIIHYNPILSPLHHHVFPLIYSLSPNFTTNFPPWHWVYYRRPYIYIYIHFIYCILIDCIPMYPHCITMFSTIYNPL